MDTPAHMYNSLSVGRGSSNVNRVHFDLPLVQPRPQGTPGRVSVHFLLSGLEWVLLAVGRNQRYC